MKIRTGFVSNSSSTSFVIAVCIPASERDELFLEMFEKSFPGFDDATQNTKTMKAEIKEYILQLENQIEELKKDLAFARKEWKNIEEMLKDEKLLKALAAYDEAKNKYHLTLRRMRSERFGCSDSPKNIFDQETRMYANAMETRVEKIAELEKELDLIKKIGQRKDIKYLIKFDVDHGFSRDRFERQIEIMEESGIIEIIKKETT